jgi:hypothetical protein
MNSTLEIQHLPPEAIQQLVSYLPAHIKAALEAKSVELECPLETTLELAIASFLDEEALGFEDCLLAERLSNSKNS